jgi:H(+)-translocating pyrophosphatase
MQSIARAIQEGAAAFLRQEYLALSGFVLFGAVVLAAVNNEFWWQTALCFVVGAALSALSGYLGMQIAVRANVRTAAAAEIGLANGLRVAFNSGTVMGMSVVGWGLSGLTIFFLAYQASPALAYDKYLRLQQLLPTTWFDRLRAEPGQPGPNNAGKFTFNFAMPMYDVLAAYAMGGSSIALFARVGGGIYTKAADVGSDLVGKVEAGIPEDDPRNPAVIADNVGDNVGDVAGMGADLFESYVGSIVAATTLGDGLRGLRYSGVDITDYQAVALPFLVSAIGVLTSIIGGLCVRTKEGATMGSLLWSMRAGVAVASVLLIVVVLIVNFGALSIKGEYTLCVIIGLVSGVLIGLFTEYATSYEYEPTRSISRAGVTGPATVIIQGLGVGQLSTLPPVAIICITIIVCVRVAGVYGVSVAAVGMLATLGVTLATDAYGPVADNAGGIAEMAEMPPHVRERTDALDALGNTTAATGKGFAIGSAVLTSLALLSAFAQRVGLTEIDLISDGARNPLDDDADQMLESTALFRTAFVVPGILFGTMMPFIFSALTMLAVGKSAQSIIVEVRRQFREIPGLLEGKEGVVADNKTCVAIATKAALREMVMPGFIALVVPFIVGIGFGPWALAGLLMGAIASGFLLAVMMANAGGAWDNAKKYVESGSSGLGGKGTPLHAAVVTGDTVGDPFKDTSGPALNILIKLTSVVALVMAPAFTMQFTRDNWWVAIIVFVVATVAAIAWRFYLKRTDPKIDFLAEQGGAAHKSVEMSAKKKPARGDDDDDADDADASLLTHDRE